MTIQFPSKMKTNVMLKKILSRNRTYTNIYISREGSDFEGWVLNKKSDNLYDAEKATNGNKELE